MVATFPGFLLATSSHILLGIGELRFYHLPMDESNKMFR